MSTNGRFVNFKVLVLTFEIYLVGLVNSGTITPTLIVPGVEFRIVQLPTLASRTIRTRPLVSLILA